MLAGFTGDITKSIGYSTPHHNKLLNKHTNALLAIRVFVDTIAGSREFIPLRDLAEFPFAWLSSSWLDAGQAIITLPQVSIGLLNVGEGEFG